jgi:hypothetical protein
MRDSADIEPQRIRSIDLDQRRPAPRPAREFAKRRGIARRIGGNGDQARVERARIGQPRPGTSATLGCCLRHPMDHQAVRALDGQDDGAVRR